MAFPNLRVLSIGVMLLMHLWLPASFVHAAPAVQVGSAAGENLGPPEPVRPPQRLAIYYGWPSLVNGAAGDVSRATEVFSQFDVVVLGDGLAHPSHPDHPETREIIRRLAARGVEVYSYVDMGVTTQNLSLETATRYVDEWVALGVNGIFWDAAGYDHGVDRSRQNEMIDMTHARGLAAFVNAWNPDDVFADDPAATHLGRGDLYLAESWLIGNDQHRNLVEWAAKADKLVDYRRQTSVRIAGISSGSAYPARFWAPDDRRQLGWWGAAMYNLDAYGYTDPLYSSSGPGANRLSIPPRLDAGYGTSFVDDSVLHGPLGAYHFRSTDLGCIAVTGDGDTWGTGEFDAGTCDSPFLRRSPAMATSSFHCLCQLGRRF